MFETDSGLQAVAKKRLWLWSSVFRFKLVDEVLSCPALAISPRSTTRTFECILKDLPGKVVGESCQKSCWRWCGSNRRPCRTCFVLGCYGVPWERLWLVGMVTLAPGYVLGWFETGCWCEHVQPLRSFVSTCVCLKASCIQSSVIVQRNKSSKVCQHIITGLHHERLCCLTWVKMQWSKAGAKLQIPSMHARTSINTWWKFHQHHVTLVQR